MKNITGHQPVCKSRRAVAAQLLQIAAALLSEDVDPDEHLSLDEAADIAKLKSIRPLRDAARRGELVLHGRQRSRTIKRSDLMVWLESRRAPVERGVEDPDIEARMQRLARARRAA